MIPIGMWVTERRRALGTANAGAGRIPLAQTRPRNAIPKTAYARRNRRMPCSNCPDEKDKSSVEKEIRKIQYLLAEAHIQAKVLIPEIQCARCLARLNFLIEGLEILSKMNIFADAYRETTDKWRNWITRMFESEIGPTSQFSTQGNKQKREQGGQPNQ